MIKTSARKPIFALSILILLGGLVLFSARDSRVSSSDAAPQNNQLQQMTQQVGKNDKTQALQVEKVEVLPDGVKVSLKNVSSKTIDGIQLSVNGGYLQIDFVGADEEEDQRLMPGAVYEQYLSHRAAEGSLDIRLLAVIFTDKSTDGDPTLAKEILDTRRGINKHLKRIRPLLEAALRSPGVDSIKVLDKLKLDVAALPDESRESGAVKQGVRQARLEALDRIEFLRQRQIATGALPIRLALTNLKNRHDKQIEKGPE